MMDKYTIILLIIALFTMLHWMDGNSTIGFIKRRIKRFVMTALGKEYRG